MSIRIRRPEEKKKKKNGSDKIKERKSFSLASHETHITAKIWRRTFEFRAMQM